MHTAAQSCPLARNRDADLSYLDHSIDSYIVEDCSLLSMIIDTLSMPRSFLEGFALVTVDWKVWQRTFPVR